MSHILDPSIAAPPAVAGTAESLLSRLHDELLPVTAGTLATYIPSVALVPPNALGISLATLDGHVHAVGDADLPFTIQSVSKPFVYALALADVVLSKLGVEPTDDAFDSIALDEATGQASNPMVNACSGPDPRAAHPHSVTRAVMRPTSVGDHCRRRMAAAA